jgi:hypothetical protein
MAPSLPTLRSWRSTIYAPSSNSTNPPPRPLSITNQAIESPISISHGQQQSYESSVTELRRRLARKASTFSLRGKNRRSQRYLRELVRAEEAVKQGEVEREELGSERSSVRTVTKESGLEKKEDSAPGPALPTFASRFRSSKNAPHPLRSHTSVSMASETSPPPVPFARLQSIATEVCNIYIPSPVFPFKRKTSY